MNWDCLLLFDDIWEHLDFQLLKMAHSVNEQSHQQQRKVKGCSRPAADCVRTILKTYWKSPSLEMTHEINFKAFFLFHIMFGFYKYYNLININDTV